VSAPHRPPDEDWEEEFMEDVESLGGISRAPGPDEELELGIEPEPKPKRGRRT